MKKLLCGLFCAMIFVSTAFAGDIDFSGYTAEQLIDIKADLDAALFDLGGKIQLQYGDYVAGEDIGAGTYAITVYEGEADSITGYPASVRFIIYESKDSMDSSIYNETFGIGEIVRITLKDGQVFRVESEGGSNYMTIEKVEALFMD